MIFRTWSDLEGHIATIEGVAALTEPRDALRLMKFETVGRHPMHVCITRARWMLAVAISLRHCNRRRLR